jgi:molecular chaperone DnaJ
LEPVLARAKRDHYAVLGVPRSADAAAIKKAFRALASEYHPDVSDDPDAASRFREVVEAYEVLGNPAERRSYDLRWAVGPSFAAAEAARGFGRSRAHSGLDEALRATRARSTKSRPPPGARGADAVAELELEFVEAVRGTSRTLRYEVEAECPACRGTGWRLGLCEACAGRGRVHDERAVPLRIPRGTQDGGRLRLEGHGHAGGPGGVPGDLTVELHVAPPSDNRALRLLAAAGAICALVLAIVTLVLFL